MEHDTHAEYVAAHLSMLDSIDAQAQCAHSNLSKLLRIPEELAENYNTGIIGEISAFGRDDIRHHLHAALRHLRDLARIAEVETRALEKEI